MKRFVKGEKKVSTCFLLYTKWQEVSTNWLIDNLQHLDDAVIEYIVIHICMYTSKATELEMTSEYKVEASAY